MVQKCPVCNGTMMVPKGFYDNPVYVSSKNTEPCRSCEHGLVYDRPPIVLPVKPDSPQKDYAPYPPVIPWYPQPWFPKDTWPPNSPLTTNGPHGDNCACPKCVPPIICMYTAVN